MADFREKTDALYRAWEPHAECYTNDQLQLSYEALKQAVEGLELSERDQKMFDAYSSDFNGAQNILSTSATDYNLAVRALNKKISSFPAAALVGLTGVSVPQLFE